MWSAGRPCAAQAEIAAGRGPPAAREGTRRPHALTPNPGCFSWARKRLKSWFNNFSAAHPIFHYQKWLWKVLHSKIFHVCISISEMIQEDFFFLLVHQHSVGTDLKEVSSSVMEIPSSSHTFSKQTHHCPSRSAAHSHKPHSEWQNLP